MAYSNVELLARTLQCEAGGEGELGMKAVATVIMNRYEVDYGEYARFNYNFSDVLFQPGQFDCLRETIGGKYNPQNIYNMTPEQIHYDIANWALSGNKLNTIGQSLWYFNPFSSTCKQNFPSKVGEFVVRIGDHCFYNPTEFYADT